MANTRHFRELRAEIIRLRKLLPKPDLFGKYTFYQIRRMISYRVLAHAALETYFESVSIDIVERCHFGFVNEQKTSEVHLSLLMRFACLGNMPENQFLQKQKNNLSVLVADAREWHRRTVRENHGIKTSNLHGVFIVYGKPIWDVVSPLLADLDAYGTLRGEYAHRSAAVVTIPNPDDELKASTQLLLKIDLVDAALLNFIE